MSFSFYADLFEVLLMLLADIDLIKPGTMK